MHPVSELYARKVLIASVCQVGIVSVLLTSAHLLSLPRPDQWSLVRVFRSFAVYAVLILSEALVFVAHAPVLSSTPPLRPQLPPFVWRILFIRTGNKRDVAKVLTLFASTGIAAAAWSILSPRLFVSSDDYPSESLS